MGVVTTGTTADPDRTVQIFFLGEAGMALLSAAGRFRLQPVVGRGSLPPEQMAVLAVGGQFRR